MSDKAHDLNVKTYYYVFAALLAGTVITVLASHIHLGVAIGVAIALFIAIIKSSLVASFFMHLVAEKKAIYFTLVMTGMFLAGMMILFVSSYYDLPQGASYLKVPTHQAEPDHGHEGEAHVP